MEKYSLTMESPGGFLRDVHAEHLPPGVGNNWNDAAFQRTHNVAQQLEGEFRGRRFYVLPEGTSRRDDAPPSGFQESSRQIISSLAASYSRTHGNGASTRGLVTSSSRNGGKWDSMTLNDKILRFSAYFTQSNPEGATEPYYYRYVDIFFYLEDDSISIFEPCIPNSGLRGGTLLKRARVPVDPRQREQFPDDENVNLNHFNVGRSIRLFGVEYVLYDCDPFTRQFMEELGIVVGDPFPRPVDSAVARQINEMRQGMMRKRSEEMNSDAMRELIRKERFLAASDVVLCFYAITSDRSTYSGEAVRYMDVLAFVEDNTFAVVERKTTAESITPLYLARCALPKAGVSPGATDFRFLSGERERGTVFANEFYSADELTVGLSLNVFGKKLLLVDADDFTREFFVNNYRKPLPQALPQATEYFASVQRGTQSSLATTLQEKMEARTLSKGGSKGRKGKDDVPPTSAFASNGIAETLRFRLRLAPPVSHDDSMRSFVLHYYTDNGDVMVNELPCPQLRAAGGCFSARRRVAKASPKSSTILSEAPGKWSVKGAKAAEQALIIGGTDEAVSFYGVDDFATGETIVVGGRTFVIGQPDDHTVTLLARLAAYRRGEGSSSSATDSGNTAQVPPSGCSEPAAKVLSSLRTFLNTRFSTATDAFRAFDQDHSGVITERNFVQALEKFQVTWDNDVAVEAFRVLSQRKRRVLSNQFCVWLTGSESATAAPASLAGTGADQVVATDDGEASDASRMEVLRRLRDRFEARCFNSAEMFRLVSTMPKSYKGKRAAPENLMNVKRDARVTPVQLRRCVNEVLGAPLSPKEMSLIVSFFFPSLSAAQCDSASDTAGTCIDEESGLELKEFQQRINALYEIGLLPGGILQSSVVVGSS